MSRSSQEIFLSQHLRKACEQNRPDARPYADFLRANHRAEAIAFIDESYQPSYPDRAGFYTMSAVVIARDNVARMREDLKAQLGGSAFWHTTDAFHAESEQTAKYPGNYRANVAPMLDVASSYVDDAVITVHTAVRPASNLTMQQAQALTAAPRKQHESVTSRLREQARAETLTSLVKALQHHPGGRVDVAVLESRKESGQQVDHIDRATINRLRAAGAIDEKFRYTAVTPSREPDLWAADLYAWSSHRYLARDDTQWLDKARAPVLWIDAQTQKPIEALSGRYEREEGLRLSTLHLDRDQPQTPAEREVMRAARGRVHGAAMNDAVTELADAAPSAQHRKDLHVGRGGPSADVMARLRALEASNKNATSLPPVLSEHKANQARLEQAVRERQQRDRSAPQSVREPGMQQGL